MKRINKESINEILSLDEARSGLHISSIARHLVNKYTDLFAETEPLDFDKVLLKVSRILMSDVKSRNGYFEKVVNPKTRKNRRGYYKIRSNRAAQMVMPNLFSDAQRFM
jgi:hypothetical protein